MSEETGNPTGSAQAVDKPPLPKRFYKNVTVEAGEGGEHRVLLDGRPVRTPARNLIAVATAPLAETVAEEWRAQQEVIDPATMPVTRIVNSALDGVASARQAVTEDIVRFAGSDLLCYRADGPDGLVAWQMEHWDPLVRWAQEEMGVRLVLAEGVMHVTQPQEALDGVAGEVATLDAVRLAALHVMTTLTGSAVIALAVLRGRIKVEAAWRAAHVDEDWQISQWGEDALAMSRRADRFREMEAAARVALLGAAGTDSTAFPSHSMRAGKGRRGGNEGNP